MANILQEALAADGIEIMGELGLDVTWSGATYSAIVGDPDVTADLETGGFMPNGDFSIKILRTAFTTAFPEIGQVVTYAGEEYVITSARQKTDSAFVLLDIATNA